MVSESAKNEIDPMSREELVLEVKKGNRSRFQRDNFAYLQTRLDELDKQQNDEHVTKHLSLAEEANAIARNANELSREANKTSSKAYSISVVSAVVALLAVVVSSQYWGYENNISRRF